MRLGRRELLRAAVMAPLVPPLEPDRRPDAEIAADEGFWGRVRAEFLNDRALLHLNHAAIGSAPRGVLEAVREYDDMLALQPTHYYYDVLEPYVEGVRRKLAAFAGCDPEELALTRNASEGLHAVVFGLDLEAGDEVVTTTHDYPTVLDSLRQRAVREGILVKTFSVPVPPISPADLAERFARALTPRTRVIVLCHITSMTGQVFPVADICRLARARGVMTVVDGAQSFGHVPLLIRDLGCDVFATSLHKYFGGPLGTGFLYVRRGLIGRIWPLLGASPAQGTDIRKFESLGPGTIRLAPRTAVPVAIEFNERLGVARKAARLRYLTRRWTERLGRVAGLRLLSSGDPELGCGIGAFVPPGMGAQEVVDSLMTHHRIHVRARGVPGEFVAVRVSPNVFTSADEIDFFCDACEQALRQA